MCGSKPCGPCAEKKAAGLDCNGSKSQSQKTQLPEATPMPHPTHTPEVKAARPKPSDYLGTPAFRRIKRAQMMDV